MSTINNENLWEKLVAYVFNQMSVNEEKEMDTYLDQHPEAADFADSLLSYCETEAINNPQGLEMKLSADQAARRQFVPSTRLRTLNRNRRWAIAAAVFLVVGLLTWLLFPRQEDLMSNPGFAQFWHTQSPIIENASNDGLKEWEKAFVEKRFDKMIDIIEAMITETSTKENPRALFYLCTVYIWQSPENIDRLEKLLPELDGTAYASEIREQVQAANFVIDEKFLPTLPE